MGGNSSGSPLRPGWLFLAALVLGAGSARADAGMFEALSKLPRMHAESFDSGKPPVGWNTEGDGAWAVVEERYQLTAREGLTAASLYTSGSWTDCFVEVECNQGPGPSGIILQASPDFLVRAGGSGYLFGIRKEGSSWQLSVSRRIKGTEDFLKPWTSSRLIRSSGNRLAALCYDGLLQFYINDQLAWEGYDRSVLGAGRIGLFGAGGAKQDAVHAFDNLSIKLVSAPSGKPADPAPPAPAVEKPTPPPTREPEVIPDPPKPEPVRAAEVKPEPVAPKNGKKPDAAAEDPAAPGPAEEEGNGDTSPLLRPGLLVRTTVYVSGKREIDAEVKRVSDNSVLDMPFIGNVSVSGITLSELNATLQARYKEFFINPQVVAEFVVEESPEAMSPWGSVVVLGRVKMPGRVNIPPTQDLSVSAAIQQAGGLDTSAKASAITLTRRKADGKTERINIDFTSVGKRGNVENDLILKPGDQIFVPESIF